jgi:hypothetical protein
MNADLEAIKEAVEAENFDSARTLSDAYVASNADLFTDEAAMSIAECVTAVDAFRAAGMDTNLWQMEAWLLHHFEPQSIGGTYQPQIRVA